ncbi:hypothetical protein F5148DRAFT_1285632 [Russula earlei]|uniref:Uncharacterized protein n=1 Tax=Russula earlei TaxID=71964 RepID=A0ACC0U6J2_9AGAM|nr:hypothetical protein F5148DRAFT_1285632 [Russula earlei]
MGLSAAALCISNSLNLTSRPVLYGSAGHAFRSYASTSTSARPPWRHAPSLSPSSPLSQQRMRTSPIGGTSRGLPTVRAVSWAAKFNLRPSPGFLNDSDAHAHEEAAKDGVLEAIKGRQQTDLMLRCTILDADEAVTGIVSDVM